MGNKTTYKMLCLSCKENNETPTEMTARETDLSDGKLTIVFWCSNCGNRVQFEEINE